MNPLDTDLVHEDVKTTAWRINPSARAVFEEVLVAGPLSRSELARRVGLSPASLTKITRPLIDAGYFVALESEVDGSNGRPSQPLDLDVDFAHFVGIKLTGDSLFAARTDARGNILDSLQAALLDQAGESVVAQIAKAVATLTRGDARIVGIGVSLSGNASRQESTVRNSPFLHWRGIPLATMVRDATGIPTVLENDVRALTAAEQWFGEAAGLDSFAVITLGAGIGCGIVANGHQVEGHQGASGLIGHMPIDERGPLCYAGHRGCAHAYATTSGIAKSISAGLGVSQLSFDECIELARQGDAIANAVFVEAGRAVGTMLALVINLIGPDRLFIAGEGTAIFTIGEQAARSRLAELLHWTATEVEIVVQPFGFVEWARGAAVVAIQQHVRGLSALEVH